MVQGTGQGNDIVACGGERKHVGSGAQQAHIVGQLGARDGEHRGGKVHTGKAQRRGLRRQAAQQFAGTAADIEQRLAAAQRQMREGRVKADVNVAAPAPVVVRREPVVFVPVLSTEAGYFPPFSTLWTRKSIAFGRSGGPWPATSVAV